MSNQTNVFMGLLLMAATLPPAHALDITLPKETAVYAPSELPGYRLVQQNCSLCHSAQYIQYQPPASPRAYWEKTVKKMQRPFGAPFGDGDVPAMVDYLVKTYGAERGAVVMKDPGLARTPR